MSVPCFAARKPSEPGHLSRAPVSRSPGRGRPVAVVFAALAILLSQAAGRGAHAGVIQMKVSCTVTNDLLAVILANTGDEAAQNVRASVTFLKQKHQTENIDSLPPNKPQQVVFKLDTAGLAGTYPACIVVDFEDLNSYPFSSVTIKQVRATESPASALLGIMDKIPFAKRGKIPLKVRNSTDHVITAACRVVTPKELVAAEPEFNITVAPGKTVELTLAIENFSGTPASTCPVHCIMEYDEDGMHYCTVASSAVTLLPPSVASSRGFWIVVGIVVLIAAAVILLPLFRSKKA